MIPNLETNETWKGGCLPLYKTFEILNLADNV